MNTKSVLLAAALAAASLAVPPRVAAQQQQPSNPCPWWRFGHCAKASSDEAVQGLPEDAPRTGTVITIDLSTNTAYLFENGELIRKSPAATGSGKELDSGDDEWVFDTPKGHMKVKRKIVDPVWRKPDWAFIEAGERVPPPDSPKRYVKGKLGKYALDLGDGILIHGTDDPDSIGQRVSHGCIRLPNDMLDVVYHAAKVGTDVYVFESQPGQQAATTNRRE